MHSYLSGFAKLIAYAVLKKQPISDDQELRATLDGSLFKRLNVARFIEDDFFHWVGMEAYNYFLKPAGLLAFVLPRSFFNVDQHDNTRSGVVQSVQLTSAWDLKGVEPLFRVPACVLFARRNDSPHTLSPIPEQGIPGYVVAGRSPNSPGLADSETRLQWEKAQWHYARLQSGKLSSRLALTRNPNQGLTGQNAYVDRFKNGATIIPRSFFFIDLNQAIPPGDYRGRVIHASTAKAILRKAKASWKNLTLNGRIEGDYFYRTALAKNIAPFLLINLPLVLLSLNIETIEDSAGVRHHSGTTGRSLGRY